jgi:hypothetical protein
MKSIASKQARSLVAGLSSSKVVLCRAASSSTTTSTTAAPVKSTLRTNTPNAGNDLAGRPSPYEDGIHRSNAEKLIKQVARFFPSRSSSSLLFIF